jgi:hypothetical protein
VLVVSLLNYRSGGSTGNVAQSGGSHFSCFAISYALSSFSPRLDPKT